MDNMYVVGVDMGGTNTVVGIVNARGEILFRSAVVTSDYSDGKSYVEALGDTINKLIREVGFEGRIKGIGMGVPNGNMNEGTIENAANIGWAKGIKVPLAQMLSEKTGLPVRLTNDANAAAIGEMAYGIAKERGLKDFIMITLGTGLGSGIVVDGQLVVGHDGFAGELGHVVVVPENGRVCGCGRAGCLETYASATGAARTAREFLTIYPERPSLLRDITNRPVTSKDVYLAAERGDELSLEIFEYTGKVLGRAFADFIAFTSPKAIILFGGLAKSGDFLLKPIREEMDKRILNVFKGKTDIILSTLPDADAAILGASALAWDI